MGGGKGPYQVFRFQLMSSRACVLCATRLRSNAVGCPPLLFVNRSSVACAPNAAQTAVCTSLPQTCFSCAAPASLNASAGHGLPRITPRPRLLFPSCVLVYALPPRCSVHPRPLFVNSAPAAPGPLAHLWLWNARLLPRNQRLVVHVHRHHHQPGLKAAQAMEGWVRGEFARSTQRRGPSLL